MNSPFLQIPAAEWLIANSLAFAIYDRFPVTTGHALVVTRRCIPTWFDATPQEQAALMDLVNRVKALLDEQLDPRPDGYNVGFNSGEAAGQTVPHVHIHVIPRYHGDVADPRGGVRHVIPARGNYLQPPTQPEPGNAEHPSSDLMLSAGHPQSPLWDHLSWRIAGARCVDVLASFVQLSGLDVIEERVFDAVRNAAQIRILVSDYLCISDARALWRLLGWSQLTLEEFQSERLAVRLVETAKLSSAPASFHPKAWQIADEHGGLISVGSSNLSRAALQTGIEWNLLSSGSTASHAHRQFASEFEALWQQAAALTPELIDGYADRAQVFRQISFEPEACDIREFARAPRPWQRDALAALQQLRAAGYVRALVAVATGMGKTWLAAFDVRQVGLSLGRRPRVLVIAHRAHILAQAEAALSQVLDTAFPGSEGATSWYLGSRSRLTGDLVIASVQKLSRPEGLERIAAEQFDYAIVDEVHHAHAPSYRRVLTAIRADFVLGLTATPERADGVDVATIFDDNLAYQATIGDGIAEEALVPFHYIGIRDTVDFQPIPWRNGRFDPAELEERVLSSERMQRLWAAMQAHPAQRTLLFCCSIRHAIFTRDWLRAKGVSSAAVFSASGGDSCAESLQQLQAGTLSTLCAVDMFNEGLDIPAVDRVIMLRPTESKVIFLQQLGRGLRASEGKSRLIVIDFVGNHRIFAQRILHLLSLRQATEGWTSLKNWLRGKAPDLPVGCLLDVELEAQDLLRKFLPQGRSAGIEGYRALREELGRRPTLLEVFSRGFLPRTISVAHGSWFSFVASEGDLSADEREVLAQFHGWLSMLETTALNKSYKMVVLRVLMDRGWLFSGANLSQFSADCRRFLLQHQVLRRDLEGERQAIDHQTADRQKWEGWWIKWPITRWLSPQNGSTWFVRDGHVFRLNTPCPERLQASLETLTAELVDWRLAAYARSRRLLQPESGQQTFDAKVSHARGRPILFLPQRSQMPGIPEGAVDVRLPDESQWQFRFRKVACNVAMPLGNKRNQLSRLLQQWFGADAGLPGTNFTVRFERHGDIWHASPVQQSPPVATNPASVAAAPEFSSESAPEVVPEFVIEPEVARAAEYVTHVPAYDLTAAAGAWGPDATPSVVGWLRVEHRPLQQGLFAAQVVGHSMEPGIPDGAWCLFRPCPVGSREGRLLLVQLHQHCDPEDGGRYTVKRYHSVKQLSDDGWTHQTIELQPLNPAYRTLQLTADEIEDVRILGEFVGVIHRG